jgi:hypothetical protein
MHSNHKQIIIGKFVCLHSTKKVFLYLTVTAFYFLLFTYSALPQNKSNADMEKAIQNPIAKIISIPFLNLVDFGTGDYNRARYTLNFQPVIPVSLGKNINLITRTIVPLISQPYGESETKTGLGDITTALYFCPASQGNLIWGAGPVFGFPAATDDLLGTKKWLAGPGIVLLTQPKGWTLGLVAQNTWSFAGDETRSDVNYFYSQVFIVKNLPKGWYLNSAPIITADWKADSGNQWTVPLGIGFGKLIKLGKLPVNVQAGYYYNIEKPEGGADWQLRALLVCFLPNF